LGVAAVILVALGYGLLRGELSRLPVRLMEGCKSAARAMGPVAIACAASGMIVGVLSLTGLGLAINNAILAMAGQSLLAALVLTMLSSLILGMGLPTVAAYLVQAGVTIPALIQLGIAPIPAHLFVFYFAILGNVTPPVAVAAYAAAGVAGTDPARTGWTALALSVPAFVVPFMFVLNPALVLQGGLAVGLGAVVTAIIGVIALSAAIVGCLQARIGAGARLLLAGGALMMLAPGLLTDATGGALILAGALLGRLRPLVAPRTDKGEVAG
jgi:TRAP-type uncharacterized transport system fused permease subunit